MKQREKIRGTSEYFGGLTLAELRAVTPSDDYEKFLRAVEGLLASAFALDVCPTPPFDTQTPGPIRLDVFRNLVRHKADLRSPLPPAVAGRAVLRPAG